MMHSSYRISCRARWAGSISDGAPRGSYVVETTDPAAARRAYLLALAKAQEGGMYLFVALSAPGPDGAAIEGGRLADRWAGDIKRGGFGGAVIGTRRIGHPGWSPDQESGS